MFNPKAKEEFVFCCTALQFTKPKMLFCVSDLAENMANHKIPQHFFNLHTVIRKTFCKLFDFQITVKIKISADLKDSLIMGKNSKESLPFHDDRDSKQSGNLWICYHEKVKNQ